MVQSQHAGLRNHLLRSLSAADHALLQPRLEPVELKVHEVLIEPDRPITHVHFLEGGLGSVLQETPEGKQSEVGMVGCDGMTGLPVLLGLDRTPHKTFMQVGGPALRLPVADLRQVLEASPTLREHLLRYVHAFMVQMAETAFANARYTLDQRLARWVLMASDRLGSVDLPLTHEFLALMLGVRRAGVTTSMHILEGMHALRNTRGQVIVLDRDKLQRAAGESYGSAVAMASANGTTMSTRPASSVIS